MERAAAIWMILLLAVAVVTALLAKPSAAPPADRFRTTDDPRYAEEVVVAADRAARHRATWTAAQDAVDAAWNAYEEADRVARRAAAAAVYPVMRRRRARGENADRESYLHHAATAACRHREISIGQLNDALAHRGWNPRLHPATQESALRRAARDHRYAAYLAAAVHERQCWEAADEAAAALAGLREQAFAEALRVGSGAPSAVAEQWATADTVRIVPA